MGDPSREAWRQTDPNAQEIPQSRTRTPCRRCHGSGLFRWTDEGGRARSFACECENGDFRLAHGIARVSPAQLELADAQGTPGAAMNPELWAKRQRASVKIGDVLEPNVRAVLEKITEGKRMEQADAS